MQAPVDEGDTIAKSARDVFSQQSSACEDEVLSEAWSRGRWLLGLLILQSISSVVLDRWAT
jgi:hypothetical protein